ncbi:MAG: GIY-YIG nuclease family protein [Patescibacteria group bacterium]
MSTVYILQNNQSKRYYIGSTNDIDRRITEHNRGQTKSTRVAGNWMIVYKEEFDNRIDAKRRERQIKSYKGGNAFKKLISNISDNNIQLK